MKNEPELSELWPEIEDRATRALGPNFAHRVLQRAAALRDDLSPRMAWTIALSTAVACLALTLAINRWNTHRLSEKAIAQWSAFTVGDNLSDQEL